jgi:reductive dehalogenase
MAYHKAHPEWREVDHRLWSSLKRMDDRLPAHLAVRNAAFAAAMDLARPDVVEGPPTVHRVEVDPTRMSRRIKQLARQFGADLVRIGPLRPEWVYTHRGVRPYFDDAPPGYSGKHWGDEILITHPRAISLGFTQRGDVLRTGPSPASDVETGRVYSLSAMTAVHVAHYIRELGYSARAHHVYNYGVMVVPVAVDAGMGELGRCGYLITKEYGANLRLSCVTTDLPLEEDPAVDLGMQDFCRKCLKCAHNCPPGAIPTGEPELVRGVLKWAIDPVRCLLFWGAQQAGCPICQVVCPWSKPQTLFHRLVAQVAVHAPFARRFLVWADDLAYGRRYRQHPLPEWARHDLAGEGSG